MKLLRIINTLNIDTALSAVSFVFVVSTVQHVEVHAIIYLALVISVLSIYNIDHLVDGYRLNKTRQSSYRHAFYQHHFNLLLAWQTLLLLTGGWVLLSLPILVVMLGGIMSGFIGVYFYLIFKYHYKNYMLREVIVALGYTGAVTIIPFATSPIDFNVSFFFIFLLIFFVALTNLWFFAYYEHKLDQGQNHHSIARQLNGKVMLKMIKIIMGITLAVISIYVVFFNEWLIGVSFLLIEMVYILMLLQQSYFRKNDYYHLIGEAVLILPSVVVLISYAI